MDLLLIDVTETNRGRILLYIRDNITSNTLSINRSVTGLYVKQKLQKRNGLSDFHTTHIKML